MASLQSNITLVEDNRPFPNRTSCRFHCWINETPDDNFGIGKLTFRKWKWRVTLCLIAFLLGSVIFFLGLERYIHAGGHEFIIEIVIYLPLP